MNSISSVTFDFLFKRGMTKLMLLVNKILVWTWSGNGTEVLFMVLKAGKLESVVTVVSGFAEKKTR